MGNIQKFQLGYFVEKFNKSQGKSRQKVFEENLDTSANKVNYTKFCKWLYKMADDYQKTVVSSAYNILVKIKSNLNAQQVTLFEAFAYFDVNGNNTLSKWELGSGLKKLGIAEDKESL